MKKKQMFQKKYITKAGSLSTISKHAYKNG